MAITNISTIKSWFVSQAKPTQQQFWDMLDSMWNKAESIDLSALDGLDEALLGKANANHVHATSEVNGLDSVLSDHETRLGDVETALADLPPPANYMLEIDTAPTYDSGRIKIMKYRYISDAAKKYEERFSYDANGRIAFVELKDDVSAKWIRRTYNYTATGELLLPTVADITAWSVI